jgi:hypothetical protein
MPFFLTHPTALQFAVVEAVQARRMNVQWLEPTARQLAHVEARNTKRR